MRTVLIVVVIALALLYLAGGSSRAEREPERAPEDPEGGGFFDDFTKFEGLHADPTAALSYPRLSASSAGVAVSHGDTSVFAPPVSAPSVSTPTAQRTSDALSSYLSAPGNDLHQGVLRGWGRMFSNGQNTGAFPASQLTAQHTLNFTPGSGGGTWNYSGPALGSRPSIAEWADFDAARRSLLGL